MATQFVQNTLEGEAPPIPPRHEDGSGYHYCMYMNGNEIIVFADTYGELLEALIPGYIEFEENEQIYHRIRLAQQVAATVQAEILFDDGVSEDTVTSEEWAILTAPRNLSQPRADWWECEIPLVVVETGYVPYTTIPRPASAIADGKPGATTNLFWVRPAEEEDFLFSLHEVGVIHLMENMDSEI